MPRMPLVALLEMEEWPALRLRRATNQPIQCVRVETTEDGCFLFTVRGSTGQQAYVVEIHEDVESWPPTCTCEDHYWRPEVLCKHQVHCLLMMGVDDDRLSEWFWEPSQEEMYDILMCAPDAIGDKHETITSEE